jgi:hypothetical protein
MRRQLRASGGIMNARQGYGVGSWVKERIRKIIPNELADVAVKAAPFVAPFFPGIAAGMRGIGRFDQRGSIGDAVRQAGATYAFGKAAGKLGGAEGSGLFNPGKQTYTKAGFDAGPIGKMFAGDPSNIKIANEGTQVGVESVSKATEFMKNIPIIRDLPPLVQQQLLIGGVTSAGTYVYEKFLKEEPPKDESETMEEYMARRKENVGGKMRNYFDSYFTFDKNYSSMTDEQKNAEVARYNKNQGGRVGYANGSVAMGNTYGSYNNSSGISMTNTAAQNRAINNARRTTNQQQLGQGRNMQRATQLLDSAKGSTSGYTDLYNQYFKGSGGLGSLGFNTGTTLTNQGGTTGIGKVSYNLKDRSQIIKDLAYQLGQQGGNQGGQTTYTAAPKPEPKTYRTYSPEAQALNMDQSTYENIISMGADPRQYYMDFQNRTMTEGQDYGTPGTANYTGPPLLKYGQVIGGGLGGRMGLGRSTQNTSPPTQAQIDAMMQQMQNNPQGYQDFDEVVKYYGSNDPYMSQQQEIRDMVGGVDTGYMSGADYYDQYVLGLDGQGIAEKYGIEYNQGGRVGYNEGTNPKKEFLIKKGYGDMVKGMSVIEIDQLFNSVKGTFTDQGTYREPANMGGLMRLNYMIGGEAKQMEAGAPPIMYSGNMDPNAQNEQAGLPSTPGPMQMAEDGPEFDMREEGGFQPLGRQEGKDDVPAMLAKNEFVMTADAVRAAGGGSIQKGAQKMYDTMKKLESRVS